MRLIWLLTAVLAVAVAAFVLVLAQALPAQAPVALSDRRDANAALAQAEQLLGDATERAARLERQAEDANAAASKAAREAAALAARIQQAEAQILATEARLALIQDQQAELDLRLAEEREPLMHVTAALQRLARRPLTLSALRSGSLSDAVYLRAMLATTMPEIEIRTLGLRSQLDRARQLENDAASALAELQTTERTLGDRRQKLALVEAGQRAVSRDAGVAARRESERVFALAEELRDLDALVARLDRDGSLRTQLASLHGPVLRPPRPGKSTVAPGTDREARPQGSRPIDYRLPATGRVIRGFGAAISPAQRASGIELATPDSAVIVAPAAGRVAFAGPYRGYGRIVIIEHGDGWTSLLTGLARNDVAVGQQLVAGAPIGLAASRNSVVTLELRQDGAPRNPLDFIG